MLTLWQDTARLPQFEPLKNDISADVLVIGGGMAGLLCAYMLGQTGARCVVAEARRICGGVTGGTTAKLTTQHGLIYHRLTARLGIDGARKYLDANLEALEKYRELCGDDCRFERRDSCVYSLDGTRALERELAALRRLGVSAAITAADELPFEAAAALTMPEQAQFHPLRFAAKIARQLEIYESTPVRQLSPGKAITDAGTISADIIIVATHFPFLNKHGSYFLKLYQHRSYLLALENATEISGMYVDSHGRGPSFRGYGGLLLLGGGGSRTGKACGGWRELEDFAARHYPAASVKYRWAAQDCMTLDGLPYIGQYSSRTPGLYVAAGFNKWGMTSSMAAAMIIADMAAGRENRYASLFSPSRSILWPQLAVNAAEAAVSLLTPAKRRCPHMGCALKWNAAEHSWDCPCHGSRFSRAGELIDNPATGGLKPGS